MLDEATDMSALGMRVSGSGRPCAVITQPVWRAQDPLADLTLESMWALAAAKTVGARAPDQAGLPLTQRLLFSSTAAVWSQARPRRLSPRREGRVG